MSGAGSRRKGLNYECKVANLFGSSRNYEYLPGAILGVDVITSDFQIQCKRNKKYCSLTKYFEMPSNPDKINLLVTKGDRLPDMVCLKLEDFMEMVRKCKIYNEMKFIRGLVNAETEPEEVKEIETT